MHISLDVTYMYINFGGYDFSGFGDIATFKNGYFTLISKHGLYIKKFNCLELAQKNHASRC